MKKLIAILFLALFAISCKKDYTCECRNSYSTYESGVIHDTEKKADEKCKAQGSADTKCYLK
jgi:hypothetical protein